MRLHATVFIAVVLAGPASAEAQSASGAQPVLAVTARLLKADGRTGSSAGGDHPLAAGKSVTHYLHAGRIGQDGICTVGSSSGTPKGLEELVTSAAHVWRVTVTGVSFDSGQQTFDLEWARYASESGVSPVLSRKQRLTLAQDETFTLDLMQSTGVACATSAIIIELRAGAREDPALADTVLQYDLWLVRTDASGKKETRRFLMTAKQGSAVPFEFAPLRSDVPKLKADQYDFDVLTNVAGQLRGRARHDGKLAIELVTTRQDLLHRGGQETSRIDGLGRGRKVVDAAWGEAVEIHLPGGSGVTGSYASAADAAQAKGTTGRLSAGPEGGRTIPAQAVTLQNGRVIINYSAFFANETVSLILRVTKPEAESAEHLMRR